MNYDKAIEMFQELLADKDGMIFHPHFLGELQILIKTTLSGHEANFINRFIILLTNLERFKRQIVSVDGHERIKHAPAGEWYSLHIKTNYINYRALISFIKDTPVFLACFDEKRGKKKTNYSKHLRVMVERYKAVLEGEDIYGRKK